MKVEFNLQEITTWTHILKDHYNIMCQKQYDHEFKFHYKMLGLLLNQLLKKFMKKAIDSQYKRIVKIEFTEPEMWAFLHTDWEPNNNEYVSNLTQAMVNIAHKYFIDITLEPYGQHNIKFLTHGNNN